MRAGLLKADRHLFGKKPLDEVAPRAITADLFTCFRQQWGHVYAIASTFCTEGHTFIGVDIVRNVQSLRAYLGGNPSLHRGRKVFVAFWYLAAAT